MAVMESKLPYTAPNFAGKISPNPAALPLCKINISQNKFSTMHVIINMGQKFCGINVSSMRAGGENGENFLQAKISAIL